jgi:sialate O-acetylesterase
MNFQRIFLSLLASVLMMAPAGHAEVRVAPIFGDHMVLQRGAAVPVWGEAAPGERIEVRLPQQRQTTRADAEGHWRVLLDPLQSGAPFEITINGENNARVLRDVLAGEVWLCSGQSNMQMEVRLAADAEKNLAAAEDAQLRLFTVSREAGQKPDGVFSGAWTSAAPQSVAGFSAAAYYFGKQLRQALDVPVGLINSSLGGTTAQSWTPLKALRADPAFVSMLADDWTPWIAAHNDYDAKFAAWLRASATAKNEGVAAPPRPAWPAVPFRWNKPGFLYEKMIAPLVPFSLRGVLWYQGEANAPRAALYRKLFPALIRGWRAQWQSELPFLWVQLPNFRAAKELPSESDWAELREAQAMALSLPRTGMATTIDIGEANDIHPKNKAEVGRRLALVALHEVYGKPVESSGPVFDSIRVDGARVLLTFRHAKGLKTTDGRAPQAFALAGADGQYHWAQAVIDGESVALQSADVPHPVSVRYAWADNPTVNLVNESGLPVVPFRTDDAPGITAKNSALPADKA